MSRVRSTVAALAALIALIGLPSSASANFSQWTLNQTLTDGAVTSATATFNWTNGGTLSISIIDNGNSNAETHGATNPDLISGIFFVTDVSGAVAAAPLTTTQRVFNGTTIDAGSAGNFTNHWQMYQNPCPGSTGPGTGTGCIGQAPGYWSYGMAAPGYSGLGGGSKFTGSGSGLSYSILASGNCTPGTGPGTSCNVSNGTAGNHPLAVGEVDFTINNFVANAISAVTFTYGTAPDGSAAGTSTTTTTTSVPEPRSIALLLTGLLGLAALRRTRRT